jgi:uncharacterized repeat protein (TIGR01451 family)
VKLKPLSSPLGGKPFGPRFLSIAIMLGVVALLATVGVRAKLSSFGAEADLGVTKTGTDSALPDTDITYTITVSNNGPDDADVATLTDSTPPNTTFVSMTGAWGCSTPAAGGTGSISCTTAIMPSGGQAVFTLVLHINPSAPLNDFITNSATVSTSSFDANDENNTATAATLVQGQTADLSVNKSVSANTTLPDSDLTYTITVTNFGPNAAINAKLEDAMTQFVPGIPNPASVPVTMTFVSLDKPAGSNWTCSGVTPSAPVAFTCNIPSLPVGSGDFKLVVHVPPGTPDQTFVVNHVNVSTATSPPPTSSDPDPENNDSEVATTIVTCLSNPIVTSNADHGAGSLRQAILDACQGSTISFDMNQVVSPITLTTDELLVDKNLTITGPGANLLTVQRSTAGATPAFRIFENQTGTTTSISGLTISNGNLSLDGGGINNAGTLTLSQVTVSGNTSTGSGGGILTNGNLTVTNSTISGNTCGNGSGIMASAGTLTLTNSTLSGNSSDGLSNLSATCNITNSTFSGNSIRAISNNIGTVNIGNTILANTPGGNSDIFGAFSSQGNNLIGNASGGTGFTNGVNGDIAGFSGGVINPRLAALANNGGPTQTLALLAGSPALDAGSNTLATNAGLTTDQRGIFARVVDGPDVNTTDTVDIGAFESQVSVEDIPDQSSNEDAQFQYTFNLGGAASITGVTATSSNVTLVPNNPANIDVAGSGSSRTLTINPVADGFGTSTITVTVNGANGQSMTDTFVLTVNPVGDTPSVTNATTNEDSQTLSGLVITRNAVDGAEITHFKITAITNGTLFKNNGTTQINNGDVITVGEGNAGLKFTPAANLFSPSSTFSFQVQGATSAGGAGLGNAATATITVSPIADTPSVTNASTTTNNQTTSGLVITPNAVDGAEVTNFKITGITNGTLFKSDGTTQIINNQFITVAEGGAGLKFTPANNLSNPGSSFSFQVQASTSNGNAGLGGNVVTATINVSCGGTVVTTNTDSGAGSLRAVINGACSGSTITFDMNQVVSPITLTSAGMTLDKTLTFQGPGANVLTVQRAAAPGTPLFSLFSSSTVGVTINISGLTISNFDSNSNGGAIKNGSTMGLNGVTLSGNHTTAGGAAFFNQGTGVATITNSTISGNHSDELSAIYNQNGNLSITSSTVTDNTNVAAFGGAAIFSEVNSSVTNVTNCTISLNTGSGGAVTQNGGIGAAGKINLKNSIVSGNTGGDVSGITDLGNNLIGGSPLLAALGNYGGTTQTMALLPASPAINAGTATGAPVTDQRGISRVGAVDIGAFESRGFTIAATSGAIQSTQIGTVFGLPLEATVSSAFTEPVVGGVVTFTAPSSGASGKFTGNVATLPVTIGAGGIANPSFTANNLSGSYTVSAATNGAPSSATFSLTNTKAATSTALTSSVNPSDFGQSVTFTATVSATAVIPAGSVQFKVDGANAGVPVPLNAGGIATFTTSTLSSATHVIGADYAGDANFNASTNTLPGNQVVRSVPTLSINDVSISEGNSGTKTMNFTVTLSAASNLTVTTSYVTANDTAIAPADYVAVAPTVLTFAPGAVTATAAVTINGDQSFEADETFTVNLSNPTNATIARGVGTGTILNDDVQGGFIAFSQATYTVNENVGTVTLTVNRTNDTSGPASVDYATNDAGSPAACNTSNGLASARCDYTTAMGKLKFAAGENQKTFTVLVNQDTFVEGPETFTVILSSLTGGAQFVAPSTATVTITNGTEGPPANLIDDARFFVRQHYHDFLNREPDNAGLDFWSNQITSCGADVNCLSIRRVNVSAAFFLSNEFQETGGTAYLANKSAFGSVPLYNRFERDSQALGLNYVFTAPGSAAVLEANKVNYFNDFATRPEFVTAYGGMFAGQYVDTLIANTGVSFTQAERDALVNGLNNNTETQTTVLRKVSEKQSFRTAETNSMFVLMEYFGYLRRDPDAAGFNFWLMKLNQANGNFVTSDMVKAFITSGEYRGRFGP